MLEILFYVMQALAGFIVFATVWGHVPLDYWWVRGFDFPRIQFIVIGVIALFGLLFAVIMGMEWTIWQTLLILALIGSLAWQLRMVLPYTAIWQKEVRSASNLNNPTQIKLMVSNVLTSNDNTDALVNLVDQQTPDVLITLESDKKWENALTAIEPNYPYTVKIPLDNLYGMHLYSRFELIDPEVKYLLVEDIPSIHTQIRLTGGEHDGKVIWLYCLHPMPPSPTEADKSTTRDAELLMVGKHIHDSDKTVILAGDLNDVAWSKTTRMFQRISQLLDPRIGRFFINTFHVKFPFLRWALDHIFHSPCFTLVDIQRMPSIGSDHFPVLTTLQYEPQVTGEQAQNAPTSSANDVQDTLEKIEEGRDEGEEMSEEHDSELTDNDKQVIKRTSN